MNVVVDLNNALTDDELCDLVMAFMRGRGDSGVSEDEMAAMVNEYYDAAMKLCLFRLAIAGEIDVDHRNGETYWKARTSWADENSDWILISQEPDNEPATSTLAG